MKKYKLLFYGITMCSLSFFMTGCGKGKPNPIIDQVGYAESVSTAIHNTYVPERILSCGNYYIKKTTNAQLAQQCAEFTDHIYKQLIEWKAFPENTTIEDLRDPRVWKIILSPPVLNIGQ